MKRILKTAICTLLCIAVIASILTFSVSAAGTVIAFSKSSLTVGDSLTVTITISYDSELYGVSCIINYDDTVLRYASGSASGGAGSLKIVESPSGVKKASYILKFTALKAGGSAISVVDCTGVIIGSNGATSVPISGASASVTVKDVSANANLNSLTVSEGELSPSFSATNTYYTVTVDNAITHCVIYATAEDNDAKVEISDNNTLEIGVNTRTIIVTAPDGTQKVYTIAITRKEYYKYDSETFSLIISSDIPDFYSASETPWYSYSDKILSITIEDGVTAIGNNAFSRITALKTVNLPESVVKIGEGAFSDCPLLETLNIPSEVEEINYKTFYNCRNLKNIDISNVISIGDYAFYRCSALENVSLNNAKYIGNFAFNKCAALKEVEFFDTLSHIGESAFANCSQLIKADLPKSVIYVDETAFDGCDNIVIKGDLNGDKMATAEDLIIVRKFLLGLSTYNTALIDVNGDENFNVIDLICLKKIIA